jgi:hypothetical protein
MRPTPVARPARPPSDCGDQRRTDEEPPQTEHLRPPSAHRLRHTYSRGAKAKRDQRNASSTITLAPRMSHTISARFCPARFRQPAAASRIEGEQASGRGERRLALHGVLRSPRARPGHWALHPAVVALLSAT